jgi:glutamine amidotransferase
MCELFAMSSRLPATVNFSLEEFSRHGGQTGAHADGWGVAYYADKDVNLVRDTAAASISPLVRFIARHDLASTLVISHIRKATQGAPVLANTQPFTRELAGRIYVFAHNGNLKDIERHPRLQLGSFRPASATDSEYALCALMQRMQQLWMTTGDPPSASQRLQTIADFSAAIRPLGLANFIYCDSELLFVHGRRRRHDDGFRPPGLCLLRRRCAQDPSAVDVPGLQISTAVGEQQVLLTASVPLTEQDWHPLREGELVAIAAGQVIERVQP